MMDSNKPKAEQQQQQRRSIVEGMARTGICIHIYRTMIMIYVGI